MTKQSNSVNGHNTIIESIGIYLPSRSVSTEQVLQECKKKIRFPLERITGIKTRRMAGESEFSIDLAKGAVADCLARSQYGPTEIDLLVCCNISRYDSSCRVSFEPNTSVKLRNHFGFTGALIFDITNACAGMFTGIYIVDAFIKSGAIRRGMVVSGEYITHLTRTAQLEITSFMDVRLACLTLGDAGAALVLEQAPDNTVGFQAIDLQTLGRYSRYCIAKTTDQAHGGMIMHTDAVKLTDVGVKYGARHALQTLRHATWQPDGFQHLIMHQTSTMTMKSAQREINHFFGAGICNDANTIINVAERGNTASTTHFVAVADGIRENRIRSGDKAIFSINASGLTIGTALYTFDDLPTRLKANNTAPRQKKGPDLLLQKDHSGPRIRIESVGAIPLGSVETRDTMKLLRHAASLCLDKSIHQPADVEVLIYAGVYRSDYILEPAYATLLAGELDLNATAITPNGKKTLAFDLFNGAVGVLNACHLVEQLFRRGQCKTAMIVAAETENNADNFSDGLIGVRETASALLFDSNSESNEGFSDFLFRFDTRAISAYTSYWTVRDGLPYLHVEKDNDLEDLYVAAIVPAVQELLHSGKVDPDRIGVIFPPQISSGFIARLSKVLNIPYDRFVDVAGDGPDIFSSSVGYGLSHARENGLTRPGDIGLIISVGSGIQVGCALYHF